MHRTVSGNREKAGIPLAKPKCPSGTHVPPTPVWPSKIWVVCLTRLCTEHPCPSQLLREVVGKSAECGGWLPALLWHGWSPIGELRGASAHDLLPHSSQPCFSAAMTQEETVWQSQRSWILENPAAVILGIRGMILRNKG